MKRIPFSLLILFAAVLLAACAPQAPLATQPTSGSPSNQSAETEASAATEVPKGIETPTQVNAGESLSSVLGQQTETVGEKSAAPSPEVVWDTSPETLVIQMTNCCGFTPEFVKLNYIPEAQVWGDGRILWTQLEEGKGRAVLEGKLTEEEMSTFLQQAVDSGFFGWDELYTSPMAPTDMPSKCIAIQLQDQSQRVCEYYEGAPEAFHELYNALDGGLGLQGEQYIPAQGYLKAFPNPGTSDAQIPEWDAQAAGVSLADTVNGVWVESPAVEIAWDAVNGTPFGGSVREGDQSYTISLQIPGVSLEAPPSE